MTVVLLGPQRFRQPARQVVRDLAPDGPVAVTNAGWLQRESEDAELLDVLGDGAVNLELYRRWNEVMDADPEFAAAYGEYAARAYEHQLLYEIRLHAALECFHLLWRRTVQDPDLHDGALTAALAAVRDVDSWHLYQTGQMADEFAGLTRPWERGSVAGHRQEVAGILAGAGAIAIAGGHVGVLLDCLRLFGVARVLGTAKRSPVIAWSAGAMALAETVVLFGDDTPQGYGHPEIHRAGLGVVRKVIPLPHARRRLRLGDPARVAAFAGRFPRSVCAILDDGVRVTVPPAGLVPGELPTLTIDGEVLTTAGSGR
jgi:hypothetical protein